MSTKNDKTNVTRIKASEPKVSKAKTKTVKPAVNQASKKLITVDKTKVDVEASSDKRTNFLVRIKDYFAGAWYELRQVRWPDRKATWSMTGALLVFTAVFSIIILLIDAVFKYLFQLIIT